MLQPRVRMAATFLLLAALSGCVTAPRIETANALAQALQRNGIAYDKTEALNFSDMPVAKIDEGLGLTGKDLKVLILRITDPRTYKVASGSAFMMTLVRDLFKGNETPTPALPGETYLSQPFVVIIGAEPNAGQVRAALKKLLREDPPKK